MLCRAILYEKYSQKPQLSSSHPIVRSRPHPLEQLALTIHVPIGYEPVVHLLSQLPIEHRLLLYNAYGHGQWVVSYFLTFSCILAERWPVFSNVIYSAKTVSLNSLGMVRNWPNILRYWRCRLGMHPSESAALKYARGLSLSCREWPWSMIRETSVGYE